MRVTRDVVLTVDTSVAWELLTDPGELAAWFGELSDGRLVELDGTVHRFQIDHVDDGRELGFVWWDEHGAASRVVFTVDEDAAGSRVTVSETPVSRASVAGGITRLAVGSAWDGRLLDLELRSLVREPALV